MHTKQGLVIYDELEKELQNKQDTIKYITLTGTSGTITQEQYAVLTANNENYIERNGSPYKRFYTSSTQIGYSCQSRISALKRLYIVITISNLAWSYTELDMQPKTDNTLTTTDKTVVGAINELNTNKQAIIDDLDEIREGATLGRTSLQPADILDSYSSTATDKALSANKGKDLDSRIKSLEGRGRYLSDWDVETGAPITLPSELPYQYKTGDYYVLRNVPGSGITHYKPAGTEISDSSSVPKAEETDTYVLSKIKSGDAYRFDGTNWVYEESAVQVTFSTIQGDARESSSIAGYLDLKQNKEDNALETTSKQVVGAINELKAGIDSKIIFDICHPINSIYESIVEIDMSTLSNGTWELLPDDTFLATKGSIDAGQIGGNNDAAVIWHTHGGTVHWENGHQHSGTVDWNGTHNHNYHYDIPGGSQGSGGLSWDIRGAQEGALTTTDSGNHRHTFTSDSNTGHTHGINGEGEAGYNRNMPKYLACYIYKRIA